MNKFLDKNIVKRILTGDSVYTFIVHLLLVALTGMMMILFFFYIYLPITTHHGETITVPDLTGMKINEVEKFLEDRDLRYVVTEDSGYDAKIPALTVMKQSPSQGSRVKINRRIHLTIRSLKPPLEKVPNIYNNLLKQAKLLLESYGFQKGKVTYKPDIGRNQVLEVWVGDKKIPEPRLKKGYKLPKGSKIDLIVGDGLGQNALQIPNLIGLPLIEAEVLLRGSGLNLGSIEYKNATGKEVGTVLEQSPNYEEGKDVKVGSVIDLVVVGYDPEETE